MNTNKTNGVDDLDNNLTEAKTWESSPVSHEEAFEFEVKRLQASLAEPSCPWFNLLWKKL